ncbi:type 4a pilus biogenesis protein PilO [Planosporangium flavigriseum]|uniref:Type IV pilus assembly protein PilO n=1 Tax=Planosporangium flavigriseum TaxID=373681 RepID=A0A8J3PPQ0_9ACTN|nr:type 4a pilus biogenesis protein PilO [Planosporangium flavigriseum]NJC67213.1 type 4a pilus biogenesis protein PilO [Planosporangium flavigriseum]GIG76143.1 hypothetical protein Pfl04_45470 [Planosporangium flavigriseum]
MGTRSVNRLWVLGGVLGAVALLAVSWFFLIRPQYDRADGLRNETATAQTRTIVLQRRLSELRQQNGNLPQYRAQLEANRKALPAESDLPDFLRDVQSAGDRTGVSVKVLTVGAATQVTAGGAKVYSLPVSVTATGTVDNVGRFLAQFQERQPRAVLIENTGLTTSSAGAVDLTLSLQIFVAPPAGTTPSPAAPASSAASS